MRLIGNEVYDKGRYIEQLLRCEIGAPADWPDCRQNLCRPLQIPLILDFLIYGWFRDKAVHDYVQNADSTSGMVNFAELASILENHLVDFRDNNDSEFNHLEERIKAQKRLYVLARWLEHLGEKNETQIESHGGATYREFMGSQNEECIQQNLPVIDSIPPERRSKPLTKKRAARLLGREGDESAAVEWLTKCIADGTIRAEKYNRQSFVFDINQFPESAHPKLKATQGN